MVGPAIVRVCHRLPFPPLHMIEQKRELGLALRGLNPSESGEVLRVQGDDVVKAQEIGGTDLPRLKMRNVDPVPGGDRLCARIRWPPDMPVACAGGVDVNFQPQPFHFPAKGGFRKRRPADVAKADEQNGSAH